MLTQLMPALAQAMQGISSDQAARQLMQSLGNCNQPLEHRSAVAVSPRPRGSAGEVSGVYLDSSQNLFGDSGPWNPTTVFGSNFSNLQNHFAYNAPGNAGSQAALYANTIDSRWFSEIFQTVANYDNRSFVDYKTTNNHFGGDNFLFNNDIQFATNIFPTEIVLGQPGSPGPPGPSGQDGVAGLAGLAGRDGVDGQAGLDGRAGDAGRNGLDGAAGIPGAAGPPGRPGIGLRGNPGAAGRPGELGQRGPAGPPGQDAVLRIVRQGGGGGGYFLKPGGAVRIDPLPPTVDAEQFTVSVTVPTYKFDSGSCDVIQSGSQVITSDPITLKINVKSGFATFALPDPPPELLPKATYP
jgi:hypothetical protein